MKNGAKLITIAISLILCISVIGSAFALYTSEGSLNINFEGISSTPTTVTLYYFNIRGWDNVYAYAWNKETTEKNATWPGVSIQEAQNNWYSITLDLSDPYDRIVFNDGVNDSGNQTNDLVIDNSKPYFDGYQWNDGFNALTLTIGNQTYQMSAAQTSDTSVASQYCCTVSLSIGDVVNISDGNTSYNNWENNEVFNGTATFAGEYTFYAKIKTDGTNSIWTIAPEDPNYLILYFKDANSYGGTWKCYAWNSSGNNKSWPGEIMTKVGYRSDNWYYIKLAKSSNYVNVIFTNKYEGSYQTGDLTINSTNRYYNGSSWKSGF